MKVTPYRLRQVPLRGLFRIALLLAAASMPAGPGRTAERISAREEKIVGIIRDFTAKLGIAEHVTVSVERENSRLVSVQRTTPDTFRISFQDEFLCTLDDRGLTAVVAHELGHIWIFTHFPYLQTEALANQQAMKLVPREDLEGVYKRMWTKTGEQGDLVRVLGETRPGAPGSSPPPPAVRMMP